MKSKRPKSKRPVLAFGRTQTQKKFPYIQRGPRVIQRAKSGLWHAYIDGVFDNTCNDISEMAAFIGADESETRNIKHFVKTVSN